MGFKDPLEQRKYQREWRAARRSQWFEENGPCKRCGSTIDLELDHIESTTKVSHKIWSWAAPRQLAELAKCQVLCRHCHLAKSREMGEQPAAVTHGNARMYEQLGCRCDLCRKAHTDTQRVWKNSKRTSTSSTGSKHGRRRD